MLEIKRARGEPLPDWAVEPPDLLEGEDFYLRAFSDLSTERPVGMGLGPIPWSRIVQYGERSGLDDGMIDALVRVVRALDEAYLGWHGDQQEAEARRLKAQQADD